LPSVHPAEAHQVAHPERQIRFPVQPSQALLQLGVLRLYFPSGPKRILCGHVAGLIYQPVKSNAGAHLVPAKPTRAEIVRNLWVATIAQAGVNTLYVVRAIARVGTGGHLKLSYRGRVVAGLSGL